MKEEEITKCSFFFGIVPLVLNWQVVCSTKGTATFAISYQWNFFAIDNNENDGNFRSVHSILSDEVNLGRY